MLVYLLVHEGSPNPVYIDISQAISQPNHVLRQRLQYDKCAVIIDMLGQQHSLITYRFQCGKAVFVMALLIGPVIAPALLVIRPVITPLRVV